MTNRLLTPFSFNYAHTRPAARRALRLCLPALVWAALLCPTHPATAGYIQANVPKLLASDPIGLAKQGFSVAVSADGNTDLVGGPFDNSGVGAVWVFTRSGGAWTQQKKLTGNDMTGVAQLGWSVALSADGSTALVGGPGDNGSVGAAWVFTRSGNTWNQQAKLAATNAVGSAEQGYSVALSGDGNTALVGGPGDSGSVGAAWVFTRGDSGWTPGAKLSGTAGLCNAPMQGFSVALDRTGATAIVGGPNDQQTNSTASASDCPGTVTSSTSTGAA